LKKATIINSLVRDKWQCLHLHITAISKSMKNSLIVLSSLCLLMSSCGETTKPIDLVYAPSDDVALGNQLHEEILSSPSEYPLLDEVEYADAIAYLQNMCNQLVNSGELDYASTFNYQVHIIDADVLNAFAAPGGQMYFYTGLIRFLEKEDDLMGVMGHEIAHADRRHSVKQMAKNYGVQFLISAALGEDPSKIELILGQIAGTGAALKFSRSDESEADSYSVEYLSKTSYRCDGASVFFQKLDSAGLVSSTPEFLSTHPSPEKRVEDIQAKATKLGCSTEYFAPASYIDFKAMLP
jgi:beta-barrel assembly-enhancing protease